MLETKTLKRPAYFIQGTYNSFKKYLMKTFLIKTVFSLLTSFMLYCSILLHDLAKMYMFVTCCAERVLIYFLLLCKYWALYTNLFVPIYIFRYLYYWTLPYGYVYFVLTALGISNYNPLSCIILNKILKPVI